VLAASPHELTARNGLRTVARVLVLMRWVGPRSRPVRCLATSAATSPFHRPGAGKVFPPADGGPCQWERVLERSHGGGFPAACLPLRMRTAESGQNLLVCRSNKEGGRAVRWTTQLLVPGGSQAETALSGILERALSALVIHRIPHLESWTALARPAACGQLRLATLKRLTEGWAWRIRRHYRGLRHAEDGLQSMLCASGWKGGYVATAAAFDAFLSRRVRCMMRFVILQCTRDEERRRGVACSQAGVVRDIPDEIAVRAAMLDGGRPAFG
jgi:hypothetical protein